MEILILIAVGCLLILGLIGAVIPVLPGPLISYIGLLGYHFLVDRINIDSIIWIGVAVFFISFLDYFLQIYGVKQAGGGKHSIRGSLVGMLLGMFLFPPFGILAGAFIGAFIGAKIEMERNPVEIAFGALWGFLIGTSLKLCISGYIIYFLLF
tara:strand:- start:424 stop:882 length:459 start_codon:yes stop_codon:yes gene_type:complete